MDLVDERTRRADLDRRLGLVPRRPRPSEVAGTVGMECDASEGGRRAGREDGSSASPAHVDERALNDNPLSRAVLPRRQERVRAGAPSARHAIQNGRARASMPTVDAGLDTLAPTTARRPRQLGPRHQPASNPRSVAVASAGGVAATRRRGRATVREDSQEARAATGMNRRPDTKRAPASPGAFPHGDGGANASSRRVVQALTRTR